MVDITPLQESLDTVVASLEEGIEFLTQVNDEEYQLFSPAYECKDSVGNHWRHILDEYGAFLEGLTTKHINYDLRQRDLNVSLNRSYGIREATKLCDGFKELELTDESITITQEKQTMNSTLHRELAYLSNHYTHHIAPMRVILAYAGKNIKGSYGLTVTTRDQDLCPK